MYKIAIAGASTLVGRELKEVLSESQLAGANFTLLDEEDAQGQLDQVGDEVTFIQPIGADAFDRTDFTFFCGTEKLTRGYWRQALRAGSTVFDLSGALDTEAGVLVRAPWLGADSGAADLFTPAVIPAHPAAVALGLLLERVQQVAPVRMAGPRIDLDDFARQRIRHINRARIRQRDAVAAGAEAVDGEPFNQALLR